MTNLCWDFIGLKEEVMDALRNLCNDQEVSVRISKSVLMQETDEDALAGAEGGLCGATNGHGVDH